MFENLKGMMESGLSALREHEVFQHLRAGELVVPEAAVNLFIKHHLAADRPDLEDVQVAFDENSVLVEAQVHKVVRIPVKVILELVDQRWSEEEQVLVFEARDAFRKEDHSLLKGVILSLVFAIVKSLLGEEYVVGSIAQNAEYLEARGMQIICHLHRVPEYRKIQETRIMNVPVFRHVGITKIALKKKRAVVSLGRWD